MALPVIAIGISIAIAAAGAIYAIYMAGKGKTNAMGPATLDGFSVTQAREGSVVPLIYGRCRVPGNIVFYGNIVSEEIEVESGGGGKGGGMTGGAEGQTAGYRYYLDVWQSVGLGKLTLIDTYVNNAKQVVTCASQVWNDGTGTEVPAEVGEYANKIKGVAHIFYQKLLCGDNNTTVPTIHFVVERVLETGLPNENMSNGSNPAAVIYDMILQSGKTADDIDSASFIAASDYWYAKGYALNLAFQEQKSVDDFASEVFKYVDGALYENEDGKFAISCYDPSLEASESLAADDFLEFSLRRPAYSQLPNDFKATFNDEAQDYSQRTIEAQNAAVIAMLGGQLIERSVDFQAFRDEETTTKRLFEIVKSSTYPLAELQFKTNMAFSMLQPGQIINVSHSDYGITSALFRILSVEQPNVDKLEVSFTAQQVIEAIWDSHYVTGGGTLFELHPMSPSIEPKYRAQVVMPYTREHGSNPHTLCLIEREKPYESGFTVLGRNGDEPRRGDSFSGHWEAGFMRSLSRKVTLVHPDLPAFGDPLNVSGLNYTIDDSEDGILFYTDTPLDLVNYPAISREELFSKNRLLFVSNAQPYNGDYEDPHNPGVFSVHGVPEFVAFQLVESVANPLGGGYDDYYFYRIRHYMRGAVNTQKLDHTIMYGTLHGWLFKFSDNVIETAKIGAWQKILMHTLYSHTDPSDTEDYFPDGGTFGCQGGFNPLNTCLPGKIVATRSGSDLEVIYWPSTMSIDGAGDGFPDEQETPGEDDAIYEGKLYIVCDGTTVELSSPTNRTSFTVAGATTVAVRHASALVPAGAQGTVSVEADDGEYTGWTTRDNY